MLKYCFFVIIIHQEQECESWADHQLFNICTGTRQRRAPGPIPPEHFNNGRCWTGLYKSSGEFEIMEES